MRIFVFLHIATMFSAVAGTIGPTLLLRRIGTLGGCLGHSLEPGGVESDANKGGHHEQPVGDQQKRLEGIEAVGKDGDDPERCAEPI